MRFGTGGKRTACCGWFFALTTIVAFGGVCAVAVEAEFVGDVLSEEGAATGDAVLVSGGDLQP